MRCFIRTLLVRLEPRLDCEGVGKMGGEGAQRSSDLLELGAVPGVTGRETDSKAEHGVIGSAEPEFGTGSEVGP